MESSPGGGTTFEIFLPLREAPAAAAQAVVADIRGGTETILVVEDEPSVRRVTRRLLAAQGYRILEAESGDEALRMYAEHRAEIALVLTDLVMPGDVNGRELAKRLTESDPRIRVIFMSGYSAEVAGRELDLHVGENFLPKPFTRVELLATIRRALDRPQASGPASL